MTDKNTAALAIWNHACRAYSEVMASPVPMVALTPEQQAVFDAERRDEAERAAAAILAKHLPDPVGAGLVSEAAQIIDQMVSDFRYPPDRDSIQRRIERADKWLATARAALEKDQTNGN